MNSARDRKLQTNLTWLDLSFNKIQKIEGLSTLKQLTDLSLQDNMVSELEGLEELTKLQCFSIGAILSAAAPAENRIGGTERTMSTWVTTIAEVLR
jgi:hypothetical protein